MTGRVYSDDIQIEYTTDGVARIYSDDVQIEYTIDGVARVYSDDVQVEYTSPTRGRLYALSFQVEVMFFPTSPQRLQPEQLSLKPELQGHQLMLPRKQSFS